MSTSKSFEETIKEKRNLIIDCINEKNVDFGDALIFYASQIEKQAMASFDDFSKAFDKYGRFLFWSIKQILAYKPTFKKDLSGEPFLNEIIYLLLYENGKNSFNKTMSLISNSYLKILLVLLFVSKKIKSKQIIDADYLFAPFILENAFKYYDLSSITKKEETVLFAIVDSVGDFSIFKRNLLREEYKIKASFLKEIDKIEFSDYLNWNHSLPKAVSMEEKVVVELFSVKYEHSNNKNALRELMNFGSPWPDISQWKQGAIKAAQKYFDNEKVDIISELICSILYKGKLSAKTENALLVSANDFFNDVTKIIPPIVSFAYQNKKLLSKIIQQALVSLSISKTASLTDVRITENLKESNIILNQTAMNVLKVKNQDIINTAVAAKEEKAFKATLIPNAFDNVTLEDIKKVSQKFDYFSANTTDATLYIYYMRVISRIKQINKIDATWLSQEVVRIINRWQKVGYNKAVSTLKSYTFNGPTISFEDANTYYKAYFKDPRLPFFAELGLTDKNILDVLITKSAYTFDLFTSSIVISKDFPYIKSKADPLDYDSKKALETADKLEIILYPYFKNLVEKNNHKFLNPFSDFSFMQSFLEDYHLRVLPLYFMKNKRERIYKYIKRKRPNGSYTRYASKPTYADLTQLFPLLETEVIYTGTKFGIAPIDISEGEDFAKPVSPAETLLKMISVLFEVTGGLYLASDFVAIYVLMYYRKNMNIRNSVIHGNNYPYPEDVIDAYYTLALLCLADLIKRNDNIDKGKTW